MALRFPRNKNSTVLWVRELVDECTRSAQDRGMLYLRASQYYYMGSYDTRAAIFNKCMGFIERLSGMLYQPTDVRFNMLYDTAAIDDVLEILSIPLLGIIPESEEVLRASNMGSPVTLNSPVSSPARAYFEAARRLKGETIPMRIPSESRGIFNKLFGRKAA